MYKVKFRVYINKLCKKCKEVHPHPTYRYIYHQADGDEHEVIQSAHKFAVALLEREGEGRPLYQYHFWVGNGAAV